MTFAADAGSKKPILGAEAPGLGAMMAGGNPASGERQAREFYPTPGECTRALLSVESFTGAIWEPACGDDAISNELLTSGYRVVSTDIHPLGKGKKLDFFSVAPRKVGNIVTNPPFDLAERWIEHAFTFDPNKLVLMLKASYWHAVTRQALWHRHRPARIYPLTWRPDFMRLGRPTMEVMWCVWERGWIHPTQYRPLLKVECDRVKPRSHAKIVL